MAGTDRTRLPQGVGKSSALDATDALGPAVILVAPQLGQNIGMAARAMLNCGLGDMRIVNPRDSWPSPDAEACASGAGAILDAARLYDSTEAAVADLNLVFAATARERDMTKRVVTPRAAAREFKALAAAREVKALTAAGEGDGTGLRGGVLFGKESKGLNNEDVALSDAILNVPLNPAFSSLNLAQAVLLIGYEWYQLGVETADDELVIPKETRPATREEMVMMFEHLERELDACGFLYPPEKRPAMVRSIRNMLGRGGFTEQEVRTMRGIIAGLAKPKHKKPKT